MKRFGITAATAALMFLLGTGSTLAATIYGTIGNDRIVGTAQNDQIQARSGNDLIYGADGNDVLYGQDGDDLMYGGNGNDQVVGGVGSDRLYGRPGNDFINSAINDDDPDYIQCGPGTDTASIQVEDVVDGINASNIFSSRQTSCERLFINGILIPSL